jgi:glycosyltransferase involved in cell wall biosynthesis
MKLSIIIPVLNSHEILRRQFLHLEKIGIPDGVEIIIVDDGSEPPLKYEGTLPVKIHYTNDKRAWTWALARNAGARMAQGEYVFFFDIDHIITREILDTIMQFTGDKIYFKREFGVLLEDGTFTQDKTVLMAYGLSESRIKERGVELPQLPNNFCIKRSTFWDLGGYREDLIGKEYPQGEDNNFKQKWHRWAADHPNHIHKKCLIYMIPNGQYCGHVDYNPFGLFHNLSRANNHNPLFRKR